MQIAASVFHASGAQQHNGSVSISVSGGQGGYTYGWSNGSTAATATGLAPGNYTVSVYEAGGCSATASFIVGPPVLSDNITNVTCNGDSTGQVALSVIGAYSPYVFNISGGATTSATSFNGLPAGNYTVYVTDITGAQDSITATIIQPQPISVNATITQPDTNVANGFISLAVTGGTQPYHYLWSVGGTTQNYLSGLYPGIYSVVITDANGCTASETYDLALNGIETLNANNISLQPNPTNGVVTVSGLLANQSLAIYDVTGRIIDRMAATGAVQTINLEAHAAGLYLVRVLSASGLCVAHIKVLRN